MDIWGCFLPSPPSISLTPSLSLSVSQELCAELRAASHSNLHRKLARDVILYVVGYVRRNKSGVRHNERAASQRENAAASGSESRTDNTLSSLKVTRTCAGLPRNLNAISLLFQYARVQLCQCGSIDQLI